MEPRGFVTGALRLLVHLVRHPEDHQVPVRVGDDRRLAVDARARPRGLQQLGRCRDLDARDRRPPLPALDDLTDAFSSSW